MRTAHLAHLPSESVNRMDSLRVTLKVLALVLLNIAVIYGAWTVVSDKVDLNRPVQQQTLGGVSHKV